MQNRLFQDTEINCILVFPKRTDFQQEMKLIKTGSSKLVSEMPVLVLVLFIDIEIFINSCLT